MRTRFFNKEISLIIFNKKKMSFNYARILTKRRLGVNLIIFIKKTLILVLNLAAKKNQKKISSGKYISRIIN